MTLPLTLGHRAAAAVLALAAAGFAPTARAGLLLQESFDNVAALSSSGWINLNLSTTPIAPAGWFQGDPVDAFDALSGATDAYIATGYGINGAVDALGQPIGSALGYLITPVLDLSGGGTLTFWTRNTTDNTFADRLWVSLVTATGVEQQRLQVLNDALAPGAYPQWWTKYTVPLPVLVGEAASARIGFIYSIPDVTVAGDYLGIDDVSVVPEPGSMALVLAGLGAAGALAGRRRKA